MNTGKQVIVNASAHAIPYPAGWFHCCVTSPPYFSLRRYAGQQLIDWPAVSYAPMPGLPPIEIPAMTAALGLEPAPEAFIGHLVLVYREVKRVLRDDGVAWLNLGDSYGHGTSANRQQGGEKQQTNVGAHMGRHVENGLVCEGCGGKLSGLTYRMVMGENRCL